MANCHAIFAKKYTLSIYVSLIVKNGVDPLSMKGGGGYLTNFSSNLSHFPLKVMTLSNTAHSTGEKCNMRI